jgi:uncharacterized protein with gpF-like domain
MKLAKEKVLRPIHPNAGLTAAYRGKLDAIIEEMVASVSYWLSASYKANEPHIAQDELPATALKVALRKLTRRWQKRFNAAAPKLADYFSTAVEKRSSTALKNILKDAGITVEFKMTAAQRDILHATINQNVALIKSIPQQYLTQVEGAVMRSVQTGGDLGSLAKELEQHYGSTKRRAAFIARDQNNKATAAMTRARQVELGLTEAIWVHSGAGKHPRPSHVKAGRDKTKYNTRTGWLDPEVGKHILPGELPNCRCISRAIIKGFS